MNRVPLLFLSILVLALLLAGCGSAPTPSSAASPVPQQTTPTTTRTPSPSSTPDACSSSQIEASVQKVHRHMREFDDASVLASNVPREQLSASVKELQRIRREAEDEEIPPCLANLKSYQVDHMNSVINTLVAFLGGGDTKTLEQVITIARQQHDQYAIELARLLGLTVVPATVPVVGTPEETATP
jgi:hypothetical protein